MISWVRSVLCLSIMLMYPADAGFYSSQHIDTSGYWPDQIWRTCSPEKQGLQSAELVKLFDYVTEKNIALNSIIIIRNGYMILEAYFYPYQKNVIHDVASVTKSITSLATGIVVDQGYIKNVDEKVLAYFKNRPVLNLDDNKNSLTVKHLLTMTSALCRDFGEGEAQTGQMRQSPDGIQYMLNLPVSEKPGEHFIYSSIAPHLLSAVISRATGMNLLEFSRKNLFEPLGITNIQWPADRQGNTYGWGDLCITPTDLAKIGYLVLNKGNWKGKQVVSREWIKQSAQPQIYEDEGTAYGYLWWIPLDTPGLFEGRGRGGQRLVIWPQKNMVVVLIGNGEYTLGGIGDFILRAIAADGPLPENLKTYKLLENKIKEAATAPSPKPIVPLPDLARKISGQEYFFDANPLGINSFSLVFEQDRDPIIKVSSIDGMTGKSILKVIPIGLDDVYRISNTSQYDLPAGAKGFWTAENDFKFIYNEAANNRLLHFRLHFGEQSIDLIVTEGTGLFDEIILKGKMCQ
jgi:CubicO group peptidase (beta-lactamase class C family)